MCAQLDDEWLADQRAVAGACKGWAAIAHGLDGNTSSGFTPDPEGCEAAIPTCPMTSSGTCREGLTTTSSCSATVADLMECQERRRAVFHDLEAQSCDQLTSFAAAHGARLTNTPASEVCKRADACFVPEIVTRGAAGSRP